MSIKNVIQHVVSALIFLTSVIFATLSLCGVTIAINETDINNLIFGLGSLIAACIEIVPFLIKLIKDKDFAKTMHIVSNVVKAIEELKGLSSLQKKTKALDIITKECEAQNIKIDIDKIDQMIETVVALRNKVVK